MIDETTIGQRLQNLSFVSYSRAIKSLLDAYGVSETTIAKICAKLENGECGPFYVYRRAAIYCGEESELKDLSSIDLSSLPLVIVFTPSYIRISNSALGVIECPYSELSSNLEYLSPLQCNNAQRKDHYKTLELDQLVESLYRALILDDNDQNESRVFIFSLLYIAHFRNILSLSQISEMISGYTPSDDKKLRNVFNYFALNECPFIKQNIAKLTISKEAYSYIFPIINFDTTSVDAEVLTSLIYRMVDSDEAGLYGHQTSFVNVEKVLRPLVFDSIDSEIEKVDEHNVESLMEKIVATKVFDPTNGPGCFLVSAYNGLSSRLQDLKERFSQESNLSLNISNFSALVQNELTRDLTILAITFAHISSQKELAQLSFGDINRIMPAIKVSVGDELSSDWSNFVSDKDNLYIVGSPEFKGAHKLQLQKKSAMQKVFNSDALYSADYCSSWLVKAAQFISGSSAKAAFVLTNSISQGSQASFILEKVNESGCEYVFGYRSFKWRTTKGDNVGVTVVIVGIAATNTVKNKVLYDGEAKVPCSEIGANLLPDIDIRIKERSTALSPILPEMKKGNMSYCADALIFEAKELNEFLANYPDASQYIRPLYGSDEFVKSSPRWCLWITDQNLREAQAINGIAARIEKVRLAREASTASKKCKNNPHKFRDTNTTSKGKVSLIVPCVTSERRLYFQMGVVDDKTIVNNLACVVYDCDIWLLALLESRMHTVWAKNAAGGHETRTRYSCDLCYNTFPAPNINKHQQGILHNLAKTLLEVRERYCDKSLAEMYTNMPPELQRVHHWIDATVDSLYRSQPFENDAERLIWLKNLYNNLLKNE